MAARGHRFGTGTAIAMLLSCTTAVGAQTAETQAKVAAQTFSLDAIFARYMAVGRSDVQITLSAAGEYASARVTPRADGSFACDVGGLRAASAGGDPARAERMLAGLVIHEVTHCLTSPYAAELRSDDPDPAAAAANHLVLLTLESVSDARAVIETARKDGALAARELVAMTLPSRLHAAGTGHGTAAALQSALAAATRDLAAVAGETQAFDAAIRIGRDAAAHAFRDSLAARRKLDLSNSPIVIDATTRLDAALARAAHGFRFGRYANNAVTLRATLGATTPGDVHMFIDTDGSARTLPVLGAEAAHALAELESLLASSQAPEHRLAIAWLQREGQLDAANLARCRSAFARLIRAFSDGSPAQTARALRVIDVAIAQSRTGSGLSALLDNAADTLQSLRSGDS